MELPHCESFRLYNMASAVVESHSSHMRCVQPVAVDGFLDVRQFGLSCVPVFRLSVVLEKGGVVGHGLNAQ